MRRLIPVLLLLSFLLAWPAQAQSVDEIQVDNLGVSYVFGEPITFKARLLNLPGPVAEAYILFRADGEATTRVFPVAVEADGATTFVYTFEQGPLRPFATVRFWYQVKLADGQERKSSEFYFPYLDNRFEWIQRETDGLRVHWYVGDEAFGQAALDVARQGLKRSRELLLVEPAGPIDIYIYASVVDLQKAFETGGIAWAGGHASPDLRVALIAVTPGPEQGLEMDRKVPHELAHILTYDLARERYTQLPVWLREGIASRAEISTNPDYGRAIALASENNALLSFGTLCGAFPADSGNAFLAYAQSEAFTRFLLERYGQAGLLALIQAYGNGLGCEQGAFSALGKPLSELEMDWRNAALRTASPTPSALGNFGPYLVLLVVILVVPLTNAFFYRRPTNGGK